MHSTDALSMTRVRRRTEFQSTGWSQARQTARRPGAMNAFIGTQSGQRRPGPRKESPQLR